MTDTDIWIIEPRKSVGPLTFGMSKVECIDLLGSVYDQFRRTPDVEDITLAFDSACVHVTLNAAGQVIEIAIFRPRKVILQGVQLLDRELESVDDDLAAAGIEAEPIDIGLWCSQERIVLVDIDGKVDGVEVNY